MSLKRKALIITWNAFVDTIPILVPIIIKHKGTIVKSVKKMKVN